jgi:phosphotransferase system enzyme I (PtsI)
MHPSQILSVKHQVLRSDTTKLALWAEQVLASDDPASLMPR